MVGKNTATKSNGGLKIVDLGTELRVDPRQIVAAAKEMAMENAKVPASWVTAGQADRLRAKFGGQNELKAKIERKLRHFESALETPKEAPKSETQIKTHAPKLGKRTYEADRRSIFGVVAKGSALPIAGETSAKLAESASTVPPPAVAPSTAPAGAEKSVSLLVPLPPPKKFIGVTVAPPIRREVGSADPRFGVSVPSPEIEKKETSTAIWNNLNDGHEPVDFSTSNAEEKKASEPKAVVEIQEAEKFIQPSPELVVEKPKKSVSKHSERNARVEAPSVDVVTAAAPHTGPRSASHPPEEMQRKHTMDVPVKWQPKNKAFGSKGKVKTKLLKKLEQNEPTKEASHKTKNESKEKQSAKPHAAHKESMSHEKKPHSERKPAHANEKKDGVLKRIIRSLFKK